MARLFLMLALCAGLAPAQEEDESGITEDEAPAEESEEPRRATAFPAREPGKKVATVTVRKKNCSLALPADWVLEETDDPESELAWDVLLPGSTRRAGLFLFREQWGDPRSRAYYRAEWYREQKPGVTCEIRPKPVPRMVIRGLTDDAGLVDAQFYMSVRNNPFTLSLRCSTDDFTQAEADLIEAARSFTAEVDVWPPIPKGYAISQEGTWLVASAPDVKDPLAPLVKALKEVEKRFRRDHGPLPKGDAPIVVLVHTSKAAAGKIEPAVAEARSDFYGDERRRRLFAVPLSKESKDQEGMLAYNAHGVLFSARYGDARPYWILHGESTIAQAEVYTGKPLPVLDEGYLSWLSAVRFHHIGEIDGLHGSDRDAWGKESFFYVIALREGKYRKRYRAFLDDVAGSGDALGAFARHLATIDPEDLRDSTNRFLATRIRPEKRKHEH